MEKILSVSELTFDIKKALEIPFPHIAVRGEVGNLRIQSSGHAYFTLKDCDAQISCVLFRSALQNASRPPKEGDEIILRGALSVYAPRGQYQIVGKTIEFAGQGELLLKLQALREALRKAGWTDPARKKKLPPFPKTIGVITSPTGAVIRDIIHVLSRRFSGFHLILNPVKVQGDGAAGEIAQAIEECNKHHVCDVLIVGRGGGSLEDLWPFNEEIVARAIYNSKIPIISAVGHETDYSIADDVADVRAPTPSAAAEIVVAEKAQHLTYLENRQQQLTSLLLHRISHEKARLERFAKHPLFSSPYALLGMHFQKLDEKKTTLVQLVQSSLTQKKQTLAYAAARFSSCNPLVKVEQLKKELSQIASHIRAINPRNLVKKGYALLFSEKDGSTILSAKELSAQDKVKIAMSDGTVKAKVEEVHCEV